MARDEKELRDRFLDYLKQRIQANREQGDPIAGGLLGVSGQKPEPRETTDEPRVIHAPYHGKQRKSGGGY